MLTIDKIRNFLTDRPLLSARGLSLEAGLSQAYLGKVLGGHLRLTEKSIELLEPILKKYGYQ